MQESVFFVPHGSNALVTTLGVHIPHSPILIGFVSVSGSYGVHLE